MAGGRSTCRRSKASRRPKTAATNPATSTTCAAACWNLSSRRSPANTLLTDHQVRGAFARYVDELKADLKSIAASGWGPELIPDADILESQFPEVLEEMETKRTRIADLAALFSAADDEDYEDADDTGVLPGAQVKALKDELKELKAQYKDTFKELKSLVNDLYTELKAADLIPKGMKKGEFTVKGKMTEPDFASAGNILELAKKAGHTIGSGRADQRTHAGWPAAVRYGRRTRGTPGKAQVTGRRS